MEKVDALASCVKGMRSADVDEAEKAKLQLTQVLKIYQASRALGGSSENLPEIPLFCLSDFNSEHAASRPIVIREPTSEFKAHTRPAPDYEWLNDADEQVKRTVYTWTVNTNVAHQASRRSSA
ncbi:hypothetical protein T484DRAFT_1741247 [Baffinella frigidus]|nr:hypothetical protein T484DRAFT_1741247 [Cryptophyta sp. CCMP2293]